MEDYDFSYEGFVSIVNDRGILKRITRQGHSHFLPSSTDIATIHYVGWYHYGKNHGELFDSSRARNKPIRVSLSHAYPIKAFAVAIKTMKCGEICEIIVFPDYAYYDPHIRRYEIELISFSGYFLYYGPDMSLPISCIKEGSDISLLPGANVAIHLEGYCNDDLFDSRDITFVMGEFDGCGFPNGVRRALFSLNVGGEYLLQVAKPLSFTPEECEKRGIPENAVLWYHITVKSCELRERPDEFASSRENMAALLAMKDRANTHFKAGKHELAGYMYSSIGALALANCDDKDYRCIASTNYSNHALCNLKMNQPDACIKVCDYALREEPNNEKCLFRKGLAYILKNNYNEAEKCFEKVLEVNPDNVEAEQKLNLCMEILAKEAVRSKDLLNCAVKQLGEDVFSGDGY